MTTDKTLADLRKSYEKGSLLEHELALEPLQQFDAWFQEALKHEQYEANAMTVATVDENGRPSCRPVLVKSYDEHGLVWYTNYLSRKSRALESTPYASLQFHWQALERVVRIEGKVSKVSEQESDDYFASRPLSHRIGAWASPQSQVISGREEIVANAAKYGLEFGLKPPRPPHWGGFRLEPDYWEFWQGRSSRLHDRIVYQLDADGRWLKQRLAP